MMQDGTGRIPAINFEVKRRQYFLLPYQCAHHNTQNIIMLPTDYERSNIHELIGIVTLLVV